MLARLRNYFRKIRFQAILNSYRFGDYFDDPLFYDLKADLRRAFPGAPIEIADGKVIVWADTNKPFTAG